MFGRLLALIAGAALAVAASQGPAFTDQYVQNLTGRIDELRPIVEEFDAKVGASIWTRPLVLARTYKKDIAESVYSAFKPAVPATPEGFAYGGGGFLAGFLALSIVFGILGGLFGGRRYA